MFQSKLIYIVVALATLTPFQSTQAGTIAHFTFENNFTDISGNGHSLFQRGSFGFTSDVASTNPTSSRALSITPNNFLDSTIRLPTQNFTVELFAKAASTGHVKDFFDRTTIVADRDFTETDGDGQGGLELTLFRSENRYRVSGRDNQNGTFTALTSPERADDTWRHLAFTVNSSRVLELFVDGVSQGSTPLLFPSTPFANTLRIGSSFLPSFAPPQGFYNGLIDDLRISNVALKSHEFLFTPVPTSVPAPPMLVLFGLALFGLGIAKTIRPSAKRKNAGV